MGYPTSPKYTLYINISLRQNSGSGGSLGINQDIPIDDLNMGEIGKLLEGFQKIVDYAKEKITTIDPELLGGIA